MNVCDHWSLFIRSLIPANPLPASSSVNPHLRLQKLNFMAIVIRLDVVLAQRKQSLTSLSAEIGISMKNLSLLKTGKVRAIRFSTLEAICRALDCQPGDLLEYVDDE